MDELYHEKVCTACKKPKPLSVFGKNRQSKDGHRPQCKECRKAERENVVPNTALPESKKCSKCGFVKSLNQFNQQTSSPDGKQHRCRRCANPPKGKITQQSLFFKTCTVCKVEKYIDEFYASKKGFNGKRSSCMICDDAISVIYRQEHLEEIRARDRQYSSERYHAQDEQGEEYRAMVRAGRDKWHSNNKEKRNENTLRYIARKQGATVEPVNFQTILERDGLVCYICEMPIDPTLPGNVAAGLSFDHVVPLSRGGSHTTDNIRPAHMACNAGKCDKLLSELTSWHRRGPRTK